MSVLYGEEVKDETVELTEENLRIAYERWVKQCEEYERRYNEGLAQWFSDYEEAKKIAKQE